MWPLLLLALIVSLHSTVTGQQCPSVSNVNPKSGLQAQLFTVTGINLQLVSNVTASNGASVNFTIFGSTQLNFQFVPGQAGIIAAITINLVPNNNISCNIISFTLDIKSVAPLLQSMSSNQGQPGTVIRMAGCFPPTCGDNSSTYSIQIGGINVELLPTSLVGGSPSNTFYIRLVSINSSIPNAVIELISQYGTVYLLSTVMMTIDYQRFGTVISSITPSSGQAGTFVSFTGSNLIGLGELNIELSIVTFGGVPAQIISSSQTEVMVRVSSGTAGVQPIQFNSTQYSSDNNVQLSGPSIIVTGVWIQLNDGVITSLIPPAGEVNTILYICGTRLLGDGNTITNVTIAGTLSDQFSDALVNFTYSGLPSECITGRVPPGTVEGSVNITSNTGAVVSTEDGVLFRYATISSVSPSEGQEYTYVTILGSHLLSGYTNITPQVLFNGVPANVLSYTPDRIVVQPTPTNITNQLNDLQIKVTNFELIFTVSLSNAWTYLPPGEVTMATPSSGQYGTQINITGSNLLGYGTSVETVRILGSSTGDIDNDSPITISAIFSSGSSVLLSMPSPSNASYTGLVDIVLISVNGARVTGRSVFEYKEGGRIQSVYPLQGQRGTYVTITGFQLFGYGSDISTVRFGNIEASINYTISSSSSITVRIGSNTNITNDTQVSITIVSDTYAIVESSTANWTYLREGSISSVSPSQGQFGSLVTIRGTNLLGGGVSLSKIYIDGVVPSVISYNESNIVVKVGNLSESDSIFPSRQVYIESDTGAIVSGGIFQQLPPGNITTFLPTTGRQGTIITIIGFNLTGYGSTIINVTVAGYDVISDIYVTDTNDSRLIIQVGTAPNGTSGPLHIVINTGAIIESTLFFTYTEPGDISTVTPLLGAEGVGVLIQGTSLQTGTFSITNVTIGGYQVTRIVTSSPNQVSLIVGPALSNNLVSLPIRIVSADGSYVEGGSFTYQNLSVSIIGQSMGQYGTQVTVEVPFPVEQVNRVYIDDQEAIILTTNAQSNTVVVLTPRAQRLGQYLADISVENIHHIVARITDGFTYLPEGVVFSVSPGYGQKGTLVILEGERLLGGGNTLMSVIIGGVSVQLNNYSNSLINVSLSDNLPSWFNTYPHTTDITIISNTGATVNRLQGFIFVQPGDITSISPTIGQYGTVVTLEGNDLLQDGMNVRSVSVAGIGAVVIGTPNDTYIQLQLMPGFLEVGSVTLTLVSGAEISSNGLQFSYITAGNITSISPSVGTVGSLVTLIGTNLRGGGTQIHSVSLDGTLATVITNNNSHIIVRAGNGITTGSAGQVVIVSNTGSIVTSDVLWTYEKLGTIVAVSPESGQQGVGVVISGVDLIGTSGSGIIEVTLAGVPATIVSQTNSTVHVIAGYSNTSIDGPIVIREESGPIITSSSNWLYYEARFLSIVPSSGINGTYVTLNGTNLIGNPNSSDTVYSVSFGSIPAYDIMVLSRNLIRVRAGYSPIAAGPVTIQINSTSGSYLILTNNWYYREPGMVTSIKPSSAPPGDNITIYGTSLVPDNAVGVTVVTGQTVSYEAQVINSSAIQFRVGVYERYDVPNVSLPLLITANDGASLNIMSPSFYFQEVVAMVTSITPSAGGEGSMVQIIGTDLLNGGTDIRAVYLAGVPVNSINANGTSIVVSAGPGSDIEGELVVESDNGLLYGGNLWTYLPALDITQVSPTTGRNGTIITINTTSIPSNYIIQSVRVGDKDANIISTDNGSVIVTVASSTSSGDIVLYFQDGIYLIISNSWVSQIPVDITNTSTLIGYFGTVVTLNGTGFQGGGGATVHSVILAGFSSTIITQTDTQLIVKINEEFDSNGTGNITRPIIIRGVDGSVHTSNLMFTYLQVSIDSVSPSNGQYGSLVTIRGSRLLAGGTGIASVIMASIEAESISIVSDTLITITAAASDTQTIPSDIVYITDSGAKVTIATSWSYVSPGVINSVTPLSGRRGTVVTVTGRGMLGGGNTVSSVSLSGVVATDVLISHDDFIQVKAGQSLSGVSGQVIVTADTGAIVASNISEVYFKYLVPSQITSFNPLSGQYRTEVTITGTSLYLNDLDYVLLNGVRATVVSVNVSSITLTAGRPAFIGTSQGTVTVISQDGSITESVQYFTYLSEGEIYSVEPNQGQLGSNVIISGKGLRGGGSNVISASMADIPATIVSENDATVQLIVNQNQASKSADITGDVILISDTGAEVVRLDGWTYIQVGTILSISPSSGQYGTYVTITGDRLTAGGMSIAQVLVGETLALEVVSSNETLVTFRAGKPATPNQFNTTISLISNNNDNFTSNVSWSYEEESQIYQIQPANGTGAIVINITGIRLLGGGNDIVRVELAGIRVREILMANDMFVQVETGFNPDGQPKAGDVLIESDTGGLTILENGWSYASECPTGQYGNSSDSCTQCHPQCDHCYGPSQYSCYACRNFTILHDNGQTECVGICPSVSTVDRVCVDNCMTYQYETILLDGHRYCKNCSSLCDLDTSCSGPYPSQCTACAVYTDRGVCVSECSIGTYISNKTCLTCNEQCLQTDNCFGPESSQCYTCLNVSIARIINETSFDECLPSCPSLHYVDSYSRCQVCHSLCLGGCVGPLSSECVKCTNASIYHDNGTIECVTDCNQYSMARTMYQDPSTGQCSPCHKYCSLEAGCTGLLASDCILCSNFTSGINTESIQFIPKLDGECISLCPNETYYIDLRTGNCEFCHPICTIGCIGPSSNDCNIEPTNTPTIITSSVGAFSAGAGTIVLVILVIFIIIAVFILVLVVLVVKLKSRREYKIEQEDEHHRTEETQNLELIPTAYTRRLTSETNLGEEDTNIPQRPIGRSASIEYQHVEISKINPVYLEFRSIELLEEDEHSTGRSLDQLHSNHLESSPSPTSPHSPSSPSSPSSLDETTDLISAPPPRPPRQQPSVHTTQATQNPYMIEDEAVNLDMYMDMDPPPQDELVDVNAPLPFPVLDVPGESVEDTNVFYEETESTSVKPFRPPMPLPKDTSLDRQLPPAHAGPRPDLPPRKNKTRPNSSVVSSVAEPPPPLTNKTRPCSSVVSSVAEPPPPPPTKRTSSTIVPSETTEEYYEDMEVPPAVMPRQKKD